MPGPRVGESLTLCRLDRLLFSRFIFCKKVHFLILPLSDEMLLFCNARARWRDSRQHGRHHAARKPRPCDGRAALLTCRYNSLILKFASSFVTFVNLLSFNHSTSRFFCDGVSAAARRQLLFAEMGVCSQNSSRTYQPLKTIDLLYSCGVQKVSKPRSSRVALEHADVVDDTLTLVPQVQLGALSDVLLVPPLAHELLEGLALHFEPLHGALEAPRHTSTAARWVAPWKAGSSSHCAF